MDGTEFYLWRHHNPWFEDTIEGLIPLGILALAVLGAAVSAVSARWQNAGESILVSAAVFTLLWVIGIFGYLYWVMSLD